MNVVRWDEKFGSKYRANNFLMPILKSFLQAKDSAPKKSTLNFVVSSLSNKVSIKILPVSVLFPDINVRIDYSIVCYAFYIQQL